MHMDEGLSIIMPVYNEEESLEYSARKVIDEAKKLTFNAELIIVDDNSGDSSPVIAANLSKEFKNIRIVYHEQNQGAGAAFRGEKELPGHPGHGLQHPLVPYFLSELGDEVGPGLGEIHGQLSLKETSARQGR